MAGRFEAKGRLAVRVENCCFVSHLILDGEELEPLVIRYLEPQIELPEIESYRGQIVGHDFGQVKVEIRAGTRRYEREGELCSMVYDCCMCNSLYFELGHTCIELGYAVAEHFPLEVTDYQGRSIYRNRYVSGEVALSLTKL